MNLELLNPWWKGKEYIKEDKHLRDYEKKQLKWKPPVLNEIDLLPNNLYTLRGPRQIGKTTLVKHLIKNCLENGINRNSIFFWNCDEVLGYKELLAILRDYFEHSKQYNVNEKYIFLDEISRIKDWQVAIKSLVDSGELEDCCIFLTGSHTLDIKHGIELLPGRTGKKGRDFLLLPMSFREFVKLLRPELIKKIKKADTLYLNELNKSIRTAKPFNLELRTLFNQYLITGGFPPVINEFFSEGEIPDYIYEMYLKWVIGDIVKWGKQEKILMQIMRAVIKKQCTLISWDSLAKEAEVKSHKTISAYAEDLENMFVLLVLYYLEKDKKVPNFNKNKKIHFLDPFIFHVFNNALYFKNREISPAVVESLVISQISKSFCSTKPDSELFYWKNKKEVDAILKVREKLFAIEIKYQSKISKDDWRGLYYFNGGVLVTKDFLKIGEKYSALPVHMFLAII